MIEVIDALLELVEPTDPVDATVSQNGLKIDRTASAPFEFEGPAVYAWEESSQQFPVGTGEVREEFVIMLVVTEQNPMETGTGRRSRAVSEALDKVRERWLKAIRSATTREGLWGQMVGGTDADFLRQLGVRGLAVRASGWRMVTDVE